MNTENKIISIDASKSRKRFLRSLEYELIASLAFHQYVKEGEANFEALLSIPLEERIPGLINEYGLQRMHQLIATMLREFSAAISHLPKNKKLTDTNISVCACDLILAAEEDQLSLEDLIIFFELSKKEKYGKFKGLLSHYSIMEKLDQFREDRYKVCIKMKEELRAELNSIEPHERISPQPTAIRDLFDHPGARIIPFKKIS